MPSQIRGKITLLRGVKKAGCNFAQDLRMSAPIYLLSASRWAGVAQEVGQAQLHACAHGSVRSAHACAGRKPLLSGQTIICIGAHPLSPALACALNFALHRSKLPHKRNPESGGNLDKLPRRREIQLS